MIVDFHAHTCESDGSLSPQALVDRMVERGVRVFSISDHDTLDAYGRFEPPPRSRVVVGVEINTTWRDNEVHVLGYRLPLDDGAFNALLESNRRHRRRRIGKIVAQLRAAGYGITMEDVEREAAGGAALGRPHVGKALLRKGEFETIDAVFRALLRQGKPGYVPSTHIAPDEAVSAIHAAGGIAVLAHPGRLKDQRLLGELVAMGLDGLEVYYPRHDDDEIERYRTLAQHNGLLATAGADFHDIRYNVRGVGMEVEDALIAPFLEATLG